MPIALITPLLPQRVGAQAVEEGQGEQLQQGAKVQSQAPPPTVSIFFIGVPPPSPAKDKGNNDPLRFRFGVTLGPNLYFTQSGLGVGASLLLRMGLQFNQWVALYYQPQGMVGAVASATEESVEGALIAGLQNALIFETTLPFLQFGFGPSLDVLEVAAAYIQIRSDSVSGGAGTIGLTTLGLDTRLALVLGGIGPGYRGGFSINLHYHPTFFFFDDVSVFHQFLLAIGGEVY
ncbi:MAG: hypothetical protein N2515_06010 [Deltaproteobacteria bacterium]|nr:hypothetical protein [Deltaproteobacteria bacterium]